MLEGQKVSRRLLSVFVPANELKSKHETLSSLSFRYNCHQFLTSAERFVASATPALVSGCYVFETRCLHVAQQEQTTWALPHVQPSTVKRDEESSNLSSSKRK